jgi:hypothetical protein
VFFGGDGQPLQQEFALTGYLVLGDAPGARN